MPYKKLYSTPEYTPIEISTDAEMAAVLLDDNNLGKVYKFTGTSGTYINGDLYEVEYFDPLTIPLTFTANTAGSTVRLDKYGSPDWTGSYSTDGTTWNSYVPGTTGDITLTNVGDKVYFKGDITADFDYNNYLNFSMTGSIAASGNINSMYISTDFENLTTLAYEYCYRYLFNNCTSLTTPPALPATTLAQYCYYSMFYGCTSLQVNDSPVSGVAEQAWTIPSSGTFTNTYLQEYMFYYCAGTRSSNNMPGVTGASYTYYTQNTPV